MTENEEKLIAAIEQNIASLIYDELVDGGNGLPDHRSYQIELGVADFKRVIGPQEMWKPVKFQTFALGDEHITVSEECGREIEALINAEIKRRHEVSEETKAETDKVLGSLLS